MPVGKIVVRGDKPCFSICGDYELDFVVVDHEYLKWRIEVKTGDNQAKSMAFFKERGMIHKAFRTAPTKGGHGEKFDTVPIYLVGVRFPYVK